MRYLLDTNIVVALAITSNDHVVRRAGLCDAGDLVTSTIALAEVALGTERGSPPALDELRMFLEEVPVLDFDEKAAMAQKLIYNGLLKEILQLLVEVIQIF